MRLRLPRFRLPRFRDVSLERLTAFSGVIAATSAVVLLVAALGIVVNLVFDLEEQADRIAELTTEVKAQGEGLEAQNDENGKQLDVLLRVLLAIAERAGLDVTDLPTSVRTPPSEDELEAGRRSRDSGGGDGPGPDRRRRRGRRPPTPRPRPSCDVEAGPVCIRVVPTPTVRISPTPI